MSLLNLNVQSHKTQLVLAAVAGSVATVCALTSYQSYVRARRRQQLRDEVLEAVGKSNSNSQPFDELNVPVPLHVADLLAKRVMPVRERLVHGEHSEELFREQLARCYAVFKEEGMERIRSAKVAVIGCGGVGSWAAVMLVRSGVTNIRLVDFDRVTMSSLNRHATATLSDVGLSKVQSMKNSLLRISLCVKVDAREELWRKEDGSALLEGMDWVIDAIDNITTKVDLIKHCHANNIEVISSMGAGSKVDPSRVQISDISCTAEDSLSRAVRVQLRKAGISSGIPVVYSTEQPEADLQLLPLSEEEKEKGNVHELTSFDDFRVRILPVFGPIPAIFGLSAAAYVLCEVSGRPISNPLWIKNRHKLYGKLLRDLKDREEQITGQTINRLSIDETDVAYILEDLYRGRSVVPPHHVANKPSLARWDISEPLSVRNCVVFDAPELKKHSEGLAGLKIPEEIWGGEVVDYVRKRSEDAARWFDWTMQ